MSRVRKLAVVGAASASVLALAIAPASAATTTIHSGSATGPAYSGGVVATNLGNVSVVTSLSNATCTSAIQNGTINSDGTGLNVTSASFTGCTSSLGTVTVTAQNLPWTGGSVVYAPVSGGHDGTITVAHYTVGATVFGLSCVYSGTLTGDGYNPNNPNRPDTSIAQAEAKITNGTVTKLSGSSLCPGTATVTAAFKLVGSGGQQLWATS
ncbi:hypothetical protein GCM10009527_090580 [Actinomadura nitritigenes]|uniref:Tat pathway signal sequence domain protein n=1 Tax=Actinomadura nitritigenes TaxID=134602 RepID=A0ABS3RC01_9ACTN|nr:hypothetical protein [Actinomadura nitritigenes]MBO2443759.1 hypothetical protein [Actinomadura nitritigenes]